MHEWDVNRQFLGRKSLAADTADRGRCGMLNSAGSLATLPGRALHVRLQRSTFYKSGRYSFQSAHCCDWTAGSDAKLDW